MNIARVEYRTTIRPTIRPPSNGRISNIFQISRLGQVVYLTGNDKDKNKKMGRSETCKERNRERERKRGKKKYEVTE